MPRLLLSISWMLLLTVVSLSATDGDASENTESEDTPTVTERITVNATSENEVVALRSSGGTKTSAPIAKTPISVSVITAERIEDLGAETVQETLGYSAGVRTGTYGIDSRGDWSSVRGASPVQYIDGLQSLFGYYNNTRPNPFSLGSIELVKGPASVLYGQGSTAGILNLVSKRPGFQEAGEVNAGFGSYDRAQAGLDYTGPANTSKTLLYRVVGLTRDSGTQVDHVDDNTTVFSPSLTWRPSAETEVTFLANIQENESGTTAQFLPWAGTLLPGPAGQLDTSTFVSEPDWDRYDTEQTALTAIVDQRINDTWRFHGAARYTDSTADYRSMWPTFPPTIQADGRTVSRTAYVSDARAEALVGDLQIAGVFGNDRVRHSFIGGFDFQDATTDNDTWYGFGGFIDIYDPVYGQVPTETPLTDAPSTTTTQNGFYLQDRITLDDQWLFSLGLRHDETEQRTEGAASGQTDDATTGRLGVMYLGKGGLSPYASYSESFLPTIGADLEGVPYEPKQGEQFELGLKYQPNGTRHLITAAAYDLIEKNRLTADPTDPANQVQTGEVGVRGLELEAQLVWQSFNLLAAYSYSDAEVTESNNGDEGFHVTTIPDHLFSLWSVYRPERVEGLSLGAGVRYTGETWDGADTLSTDPYTLYDLMVGYRFGSFDLRLNVDNATDKVYVTTVLARGDAFYGLRRTVTGSIAYRF